MLGQNVFSLESVNDCVCCAPTSKQQHKILPKQANHYLFGEFDILLRFQYMNPSTYMKQTETQHYNDTLLHDVGVKRYFGLNFPADRFPKSLLILWLPPLTGLHLVNIRYGSGLVRPS